MQFLEEKVVHLMHLGTTEWLGHEPRAGAGVWMVGDPDTFGIVLGRTDCEHALVAWSREPGLFVRLGKDAADQLDAEIIGDLNAAAEAL